MKASLVALLAALALLAAWSGSTGLGASAGPASGGTIASVQGSNVTIAVHVDLCCAHSSSEETIYGPLIQEEVTQAQAMWNRALAKLPVKSCLKLQVAFDVRLLRSPKWGAGYHRIEIDFYKSGMSFSKDPGMTSPYDDTTTVYTEPVEGQFFDSAMTVATWAHELGHLMGLGDDYSHGGTAGPHGKPLPGREGGTMMADSGAHLVDQNLADRLAAIANHSATKLPGCQWTGTIESDSQRVYVYSDGGGAQCNDHWHSEISFTVQFDGTISGTAQSRLSSGPSCSGRIDTGGFATFPPAKAMTMSVSGSQQPSGFTLTLGAVNSDGVSYAGITSLSTRPPFTDLTGPPLVIPSTTECAAGGTIPTSYTLISDTLSASNVFALKCATSPN